MNFEDLSPELKEKVRACTTPEQALELAKEEGYTLSDEELKGIAGGWGGTPDCTSGEHNWVNEGIDPYWHKGTRYILRCSKCGAEEYKDA